MSKYFIDFRAQTLLYKIFKKDYKIIYKRKEVHSQDFISYLMINYFKFYHRQGMYRQSSHT